MPYYIGDPKRDFSLENYPTTHPKPKTLRCVVPFVFKILLMRALCQRPRFSETPLKSEDEPSWKKEPERRWQSWRWRSQSSGPDWKKKSDEDGSWKAEDWKSQRGWNSGGSWKQSNWNYWKRGYGAPKGQTPKVKARPSTRDDDMEADWDYWSIAIENCKNDVHRVASPAEARDTGAAERGVGVAGSGQP